MLLKMKLILSLGILLITVGAYAQGEEECLQNSLKFNEPILSEVSEISTLLCPAPGVVDSSNGCHCPYNYERLSSIEQKEEKDKIEKCFSTKKHSEELYNQFIKLYRAYKSDSEKNLSELEKYILSLPPNMQEDFAALILLEASEKDLKQYLEKSLAKLNYISNRLSTLAEKQFKSLEPAKIFDQTAFHQLEAELIKSYGFDQSELQLVWSQYQQMALGKSMVNMLSNHADLSYKDFEKAFLPFAKREQLRQIYFNHKISNPLDSYLKFKYFYQLQHRIAEFKFHDDTQTNEILDAIAKSKASWLEINSLMQEFPEYLSKDIMRKFIQATQSKANKDFEDLLANSGKSEDWYHKLWKWIPRLGESIIDVTAGSAAYWYDNLIHGDTSYETNRGIRLIEYLREEMNESGVGSIHGTLEEMALNPRGNFSAFLNINPAFQLIKGVAGDLPSGLLEGLHEGYVLYARSVNEMDRGQYEQELTHNKLLQAGEAAFTVAEVSVSLLMVATSGNTGGLTGALGRAKHYSNLLKNVSKSSNPILRLSRLEKINRLTNLRHLSSTRKAVVVAGLLSGASAVGGEIYQMGNGENFSIGDIANNTLRGTKDSLLFMGALAQTANKVGVITSANSTLNRQTAASFSRKADFYEGFSDTDNIVRLWENASNANHGLGAAVLTLVNLIDTYDMNLAGINTALAQGHSSTIDLERLRMNAMEFIRGKNFNDAQKKRLLSITKMQKTGESFNQEQKKEIESIFNELQITSEHEQKLALLILTKNQEKSNDYQKLRNAIESFSKLSNKNLEAKVKLLQDPFSALAAKILLIRKAKYSIDITYYIVKNDTSGAILLNELKKALKRGVKIRFMYDTFGSSKKSDIPLLSQLEQLSAMQGGFVVDENGKPTNERATFEAIMIRPLGGIMAHPDKLLHLAKSFVTGHSAILPSLDYSRRSHDKILLVDQGHEHAVAVLGGRNWSDHYYNIHQKEIAEIEDFEFMLTNISGQEQGATQYIAQYFELLYSHLGNVKVEKKETSREEKKEIARDRFSKIHNYEVESNDKLENKVSQLSESDFLNTEFENTKVSIFNDTANLYGFKLLLPNELKSHLEKMSTHEQLGFLINKAKSKIRLASPFLYLTKTEIKQLAFWLKADPHRNLELYVNSSKSSPNAIGQLIVDSVLIPNLQAEFKALGISESQYKIYVSGEKDREEASFIHGKVYAIDNEVMIGTNNLDPRSRYLNSELQVSFQTDQGQKELETWFSRLRSQSLIYNSAEWREKNKIDENWELRQKIIGEILQRTNLYLLL
jgi:cardiolipin synthase C